MENSKPVNMTFTVASIQDGIGFWLRTQVFREDVSVKNISWDDRERLFLVEIDREETP